MFYTDDVMSKRYNGELNFISNILRSVYSCLVGTIILYVINAFSTYYPLLDTIIVEGKNYERSFILVRHFLRILKLKFSIHNSTRHPSVRYTQIVKSSGSKGDGAHSRYLSSHRSLYQSGYAFCASLP